MSNYNSIYTGAQFDSAVGTALSARAAQGLLKGDGAGGVTAAVAGTDYQKAIYGAAVDANGLMAFKDANSNTMFSAQLPLYDGKQIINYGFHIDGSVSDPADAVTYLADAVGMKPAHMDFDNGVFDYGSWEDAFFMPRPCMLKFDGTVDYYLDPDDYSKKADGTASDVATSTTANAMMEWGRDGYKIWYKIVPDDGDNTSASIYISNVQIDSGYKAWSFIDSKGNYIDHFYTGIYDGSLSAGGGTRSLSGTSPNYGDETMYSIALAARTINSQAQNYSVSTPIWGLTTFADYTLISLLSLLITKTRDEQTAIGRGVGSGSAINSGTMNDKGLFYGLFSAATDGVKLFGMENWWGNKNEVVEGGVIDWTTQKLYYKMTYGTQDGSGAAGYWPAVCGASGNVNNWYTQLASTHLGGTELVDTNTTSKNNAVRVMHFFGDHLVPWKVQSETSVSRREYWCGVLYDRFNSSSGGNTRMFAFGGDAGAGWGAGPFTTHVSWGGINPFGTTYGFRLSCKPLAS